MKILSKEQMKNVMGGVRRVIGGGLTATFSCESACPDDSGCKEGQKCVEDVCPDDKDQKMNFCRAK